jgi:hypothetical protein
MTFSKFFRARLALAGVAVLAAVAANAQTPAQLPVVVTAATRTPAEPMTLGSAVLRTIARALLARAFAGKPTGFAHAAPNLDTPRCGSVMRYRSATVAGLHGLPCDSGVKRTTDAASDRPAPDWRKRIREYDASTDSYASICGLAKGDAGPSLRP